MAHNLFTVCSQPIHRMFTTYSPMKKSLKRSCLNASGLMLCTGNLLLYPLLDRLVTDPEEKANILNNQFVSVFSKPSSTIDYSGSTRQSCMPDIQIAKRGVRKQLNHLKPNKAAGPDGISPSTRS